VPRLGLRSNIELWDGREDHWYAGAIGGSLGTGGLVPLLAGGRKDQAEEGSMYKSRSEEDEVVMFRF
jgi:hypothetical protein